VRKQLKFRLTVTIDEAGVLSSGRAARARRPDAGFEVARRLAGADGWSGSGSFARDDQTRDRGSVNLCEAMTDEELQKVLREMHDRITDGFLRFEALRVTLEESVSPEFRERFEANLALIQKHWEQSLQAHLVKNLEDRKHELMRLLLERHEGKKQ